MYKYMLSVCDFPGCDRVVYVDRELACKSECISTLCHEHRTHLNDARVVTEVLHVCERCEDNLITSYRAECCDICKSYEAIGQKCSDYGNVGYVHL